MECVNTEILLKALKTLTSVQTVPTGSIDKPLTFDSLLEHNIQLLKDDLSTDSSKHLQDMLQEPILPLLKASSSRHLFISYCLKLLDILQYSFKVQLEDYARTPQIDIKPSSGPKMSPDTLSFEEQRTVQTVLQFVVCLALCPYLQPGVGLPISMRTGFSSLVSETDIDNLSESDKDLCMFAALKVLISCASIPSLGTLILTKHLGDILAGLVQLIHTSKVPTDKISVQTDSEEKMGTAKLPNIAGMKLDTPATVVDIIRAGANKSTQIDSSSQCTNEAIHGASAVCKDSHSALVDYGAVNETGSEQCVKSTCTGKVDVLYCERMLEELTRKVYPPLLVRTLLLLQGGPKSKKQATGKGVVLQPAPDWLRQFCGQQLTQVVMRPKGVQSVLRGMLDSPGAGQGMTDASDWRKCDAVAKVIACCPLQSVSQSDYYQHIGPQVLELLHIQDPQVCSQFLRVATTTIAQMYRQSPQLTLSYILQPLLQPLMLCFNEPEGHSCVIVNEKELSQCIQDCHKVYVCGGTQSSLLMVSLTPVVRAIYHLWSTTFTSVWTCKNTCKEILVNYLKQIDKDQALVCLKELTLPSAALSTDPQYLSMLQYPRMPCNVGFSHSDDGGVMVTQNEQLSLDKDEMTGNMECVVALIEELQQSGLAGSFLVYLLQELTHLIRSEVDEAAGMITVANIKITKPGNSLEVPESEGSVLNRKLSILNLLASLCEKMGPDCIQDAHQTLCFVKATLERSIHVCKASEDIITGMFESETITMAMGLLTALLTGAFELSAAERSQMAELSPLLQELSSNHPESSVQEMATDIRIAIATHGAVFSELAKSYSMTQKKKEPSPRTQKEAKGKAYKNCKAEEIIKTVNPKPLIEVVSSHEFEDSLPQTMTQDSQHSLLSSKTGIERKSGGDSESVKGKRPSCSSSRTKIATNEQYKDGKDVEMINSDISDRISDKIDDDKTTSFYTSKSIKHSSDNLSTSKENNNAEVGFSSELDLVFKELTDALIPVRGHGLIRLTRMVKAHSPEVDQRRETVLTIFLENLDHDDSYMYLSAINGLAAMSDWFPDLLVPTLCKQFAMFDQQGIGGGSSDNGSEKLLKKRSTELRMKLGEILVKAARNLGPMIPQYRDVMLRSVLVGTRDDEPLIRASSLSVLGDICKLLHFSLGLVLHEVYECVSRLLSSDQDVSVRRAAGQCLTLLMQGAGETSIKVLEPVIKDVYRCLKMSATVERDEGVRQHISLALAELDTLTRRYLFPPQTLQKKISVLDFE